MLTDFFMLAAGKSRTFRKRPLTQDRDVVVLSLPSKSLN